MPQCLLSCLMNTSLLNRNREKGLELIIRKRNNRKIDTKKASFLIFHFKYYEVVVFFHSHNTFMEFGFLSSYSNMDENLYS